MNFALALVVKKGNISHLASPALPPTGLFQHFKAIADAVPDMPIVLYNIPGRCGVKMNPDTVARLYNACGSIVAVKEATGSLDNASATAAACPIIVLSGDDSLVLPLLSIGGRGVISVLSNMDPRFMKAIVDPVGLRCFVV